MAKKRRYHPLVPNDLSSVTAYYDEIAGELGNRFRASVRNRPRTVADRPESFERIHDQVRAALVDRFPYVVIFEDHSDSVTILGIFHAASDQQGWFTRSSWHGRSPNIWFCLKGLRHAFRAWSRELTSVELID